MRGPSPPAKLTSHGARERQIVDQIAELAFGRECVEECVDLRAASGAPHGPQETPLATQLPRRVQRARRLRAGAREWRGLQRDAAHASRVIVEQLRHALAVAVAERRCACEVTGGNVTLFGGLVLDRVDR